jgi:hypothetical protein
MIVPLLIGYFPLRRRTCTGMSNIRLTCDYDIITDGVHGCMHNSFSV